jgi:hypothetical protein
MALFPHPIERRDPPHRPGFNFTLHMRRLCQDAVTRLPELRHIDADRVAIGFRQTRKAVGHGLYASLTPLRFAGGRSHIFRRGRKWGIQNLHDQAGREMLYVLNFYLPRFLNVKFRDKAITIFHELWHIGPKFDGDLRRFEGRCYAHSGSQKHFDAQASALAESWLSLNPPPSLYEFLKYDFSDLVKRYGPVYGQKITGPKLIPLE